MAIINLVFFLLVLASQVFYYFTFMKLTVVAIISNMTAEATRLILKII